MVRLAFSGAPYEVQFTEQDGQLRLKVIELRIKPSYQPFGYHYSRQMRASEVDQLIEFLQDKKGAAYQDVQNNEET